MNETIETPNLARRFRPGGNRREDLFLRASCVPRGSRGDGGRGGGAGARATRASGDGCTRVAETSRASPRGRAREDARARASRPPRATPEKNRGTETSTRAKRRGDGRGPWDFQGLFPVSNGAMPPERAGDVEDVPSCAWVATADPRRRSPPCRSSRGRGRIETRVEESRMKETAFSRLQRWFFILFARREKAGAGTRGALRTRAPATGDARRGPASDAEFDWPREPSRYALSASRNGPRVSKKTFQSSLLSREKTKVQKRRSEIRQSTV